ncbi:MAG TPA: hypothetical protein DGZ24_07590 [Rhodospirillaceae bacterium]|nr:hypothetical protein [Rhodospirillaceae bacterium]
MISLDFISTAYSLSGLAVGILVGMTGVGGGSLMTPLLILMFGIHPATAVGTDLFFAAATKAGGTLFHGFARTIDWRVVLRLAMGSVPATIITLLALYLLDIRGTAAQGLITGVLSAALFATALVLIFHKRILKVYSNWIGILAPERTIKVTIIVGAVLGVLVSISSVGAGALGVTALLALYPHLPLVRIVGSDIAHAVPLTLLAGIGHWLLGSVDLTLLGSLLLGSIPGIFIGSYIAGRIPENLLRLILAITLLLIALRLVL